MMKIILANCLFLSCITLAAEGTLKIQYHEKTPPSGSETLPDPNFNITAQGATDKDKDALCSNSTSAHIKRRNCRIFWRPTWHYAGAGKVSIADCAESADKSVIAIAENPSPKEKKIKGRIVFMDCGNYSIVQAVELPGFQLSRIVFDNADTLYAIGMTEGREATFQLLKINCRQGTVEGQSKLPDKVYDLLYIPGSNQLILSFGSLKKIAVFALNNFSAPPRFYQTQHEKAALGIKNGRLLMACSNGVFEYNFWRKGSDKIVVLPDIKARKLYVFDKSMLIFAASGKVFSVFEQRVEMLCTFSECALAYSPEKSMVFLPSGKKNSLESFSLPAFNPGEKIPANRLKPKTAGSVTFMFYLGGDKRAIMIFDNQGNIYVVHAQKRRWRKQLIFSALD